jgi:hypothetical protein
MCWLSLTDLFLVGLALDVVGVVVLAKGLLLKPDTVLYMSTTYPGTNGYMTVDRAQQRVAAEFGLAYLGIGFLLQAVGYCAEVGGAQTATGAVQLAVALLLAGLAVGVASLIWITRARWRADLFFNRVLQLQHAQERQEWEATNIERKERGETLEPLPSWLESVPNSPWAEDAAGVVNDEAEDADV